MFTPPLSRDIVAKLTLIRSEGSLIGVDADLALRSHTHTTCAAGPN